MGKIAFNAARRAVLRCAPYAMLPESQHDDWRQMRIKFRRRRPLALLGRFDWLGRTESLLCCLVLLLDPGMTVVGGYDLAKKKFRHPGV